LLESHSMSRGVHFLLVTSFTAFLVALNRLGDKLNSIGNIGLIVFDGFDAALDRTVEERWRPYQHKHLVQILSRTCTLHDVAAVLTVNLSTKMISEDGSAAGTRSKAIMISQLGGLGLRKDHVIVLKRNSRTAVTAMTSTKELMYATQRNLHFELVWKGGVTSIS